jgi:osmotically-inducible protein OsmY
MEAHMKNAETMQLDVLDELAWDPAVDSSAIGVTAIEGIVTLTGEVSSYAEKLAAGKAALRVTGVKALVDNLMVRIKPPQLHDDELLAEAASTALRWSIVVPSNAVSVTVEHGWIKLTGAVPWFFQSRAAEEAVRSLSGVKGVVNQIMVKPLVTPSDLKSKIEAAFKRNAQIDADQVMVTVRDGKVTLLGTVRSWAEKQEAEDAAWAAPGVKEVKNEIAVHAPVATAW